MCLKSSFFLDGRVAETKCAGLTKEHCCKLGGEFLDKNSSGSEKINRCIKYAGKGSEHNLATCKITGNADAPTLCAAFGGVVFRTLTCADYGQYFAQQLVNIDGIGTKVGREMCGKEFANREFGSMPGVDNLFALMADMGCCGFNKEGKPASHACVGTTRTVPQGNPCMDDHKFQPHMPWTVRCQGMGAKRCKEAGGSMASNGCACEFSSTPADGKNTTAVFDPVWLCESAGAYTARVTETCQTIYDRTWRQFKVPTDAAGFTKDVCTSSTQKRAPGALCANPGLPNWSVEQYARYFARNSSCCTPTKSPGEHLYKCQATTTTTTPPPDKAVTKCTKGFPKASEGDASKCTSIYKDETCEVTCPTGYKGKAAIYTCGDDSTLTGSPPSCTLIMCNVSSIPELVVAGRSYQYVHQCDKITVGRQCGISCPKGFDFTTGERYMYYSCSNSGDFQGWTLSPCSKKKCLPHTIPRGRGVDNLKCKMTEVGANCTLPCKTGFAGTATEVQCDMNGVFTGQAPVCTPLPCSLEPWMQDSKAVHNCDKTYLNQECGSMCAKGFKGTPVRSQCKEASNTIRFESSGALNCEGRKCNRRMPFGVGVNNSDCLSKTTGETCELSCLKGYETSAKASPACQASGAFSAVSGYQCLPKMCGYLSAVAGFQYSDGVAHTCNGKKYSQSCVALCDYGYTMTGWMKLLLCDDAPSHAGFAS